MTQQNNQPQFSLNNLKVSAYDTITNIGKLQEYLQFLNQKIEEVTKQEQQARQTKATPVANENQVQKAE